MRAQSVQLMMVLAALSFEGAMAFTSPILHFSTSSAHRPSTSICPAMSLLVEPATMGDIFSAAKSLAPVPVLLTIARTILPHVFKVRITTTIPSYAEIYRAIDRRIARIQLLREIFLHEWQKAKRSSQHKEMKRAAKRSSSVACIMYFKNLRGDDRLHLHSGLYESERPGEETDRQRQQLYTDRDRNSTRQGMNTASSALI